MCEIKIRIIYYLYMDLYKNTTYTTYLFVFVLTSQNQCLKDTYITNILTHYNKLNDEFIN